MSVEISPVVVASVRSHGSSFSARSIDIEPLGTRGSPLVVVDDFRLRGAPFGPHPHAGFSTISYVFEDSEGALRSRDSLGNDIFMGPGGIVWTEAGSGMMHHELAEAERELHGVQIFVNVSAIHKGVAPRVLSLATSNVPDWRNEAGDRVRVVVGAYAGVSSPLLPTEPFDLLDVQLRREIALDLSAGRNALVYVRDGEALVRADGTDRSVAAGRAVALFGTGGRVTLEAVQAAAVLVLSGAEIREPVVAEGPFIMNDRAQIAAAYARYRAGEMGRLAPL